jgi:hypothetical protein
VIPGAHVPFRAALALFVTLSGAAAADDDPTRADEAAARVARVRAAQAEVARIRDLPFLADVLVESESPSRMRERMAAEIADKVDSGEIDDTAFAWAMLGLAPRDLRLTDVLLAILEEAVGGYYNAEDKRLVIVDRSDPELDATFAEALEAMVIAHELVHALQDQHFDLERLTGRDLDNGDVAVALQSLVEGDASYAMLYQLIPDPDLIPLDRLGPMLAAAGGASSDMGGAMGEAPRALVEPLTFPYTQGLLFAQQVKLSGEGWSAVDAAYAAPPLSSEQILHPEKYLSATPDWPLAARLDRPERWLGRGWRLAESDAMGELGVALILAENLPDLDAAPVAEGWGGDRLVVWRRGPRRGAVAWLTTWDTPADADAFHGAAFELVRALRPGAVWLDAGDRVDGIDGSARHALRRAGADVTLYLDLPKGRLKAVERSAARTRWERMSTLDQIAPWEPADHAP